MEFSSILLLRRVRVDTGASTETMVVLARLAERCPGLFDRLRDECSGSESLLEATAVRDLGNNWHRSDVLAALYTLTRANALRSEETTSRKRYAATPLLNSTVEAAKNTAALLPELRRQFDIEHQPTIVVSWPSALREPGFRRWRSSRIALVSLIDDARLEATLVFPFMDVEGVDEVARAAERALERGVKVTLLTRYLSDPESANVRFADRLRRVDSVGNRFNSRNISSGDEPSRELLHAKVLIIDGGERAYVGSANLTLGGLGQAIEIGVTLEGAAARSLAELVKELVSYGRSL